MSFSYHYSLPANSSDGVAKEVKGVLSIEGEELLFEYKLYDQSGTAISTLNKFSILVDYLTRTHFRKGVFHNKLVLESTLPVYFNPVPGSSDGKLALSIKNEDRKEAQQFSAKINEALVLRRDKK